MVSGSTDGWSSPVWTEELTRYALLYLVAFGVGLGEVAGKVFRIGHLGSLTDAYTEVARRLGVLPSNVTHATKPTLIN